MLGNTAFIEKQDMIDREMKLFSMVVCSFSRYSVRSLSSRIQRKRVSIVGSGPSGFYTAYHLLKTSPVPIHVTIWERLLVPFGLSRYGVAPDHPEVKNCEDTFTKCAEEYSGSNHKHKFEFIGGIEIGKQVQLSQLLAQEDAVILSYGCIGDKKLGIEGESNTKGVFSSRYFVNWYNGHPDFANDPDLTNFNWSKVHRVGIIGNGNVALDLARVLLSNQIKELWDSTDISPVALECLRKAPIKEVKLIARRDFVHSKFTNKELRELWELEKYGIYGSIDRNYFNSEMFDENNIKDRVFKRRVEMCTEYLKPFQERTKRNYKKYVPPSIDESKTKFWKLDYMKSPLKINSDQKGTIKSLTLCENEITDDNRVIALHNEKITYDMDLLITSLGYAGKALHEFSNLGIKFDRDHLSNIDGRVQEVDGTIFPKLYASGWIKKGSQGVIASTMQGAFEVADTVIQDLSCHTNRPEATRVIDLTDIRHTTWADWQKINRSELSLGMKQNKTRVKYLSNDDIWKLLESS